jgi:hypothetical protein
MNRAKWYVALAIIFTLVVGIAHAAETAAGSMQFGEVVRTTVDAYIRFLPRYYGELMFRGATRAPVANDTPRAPLGQIGYRNGLITPDIKVVVRPNNDTIYGNGYLDLSKEPYIIKVPENPEKRFWSIQIADRWTNILPGIGSRLGSKPGLYALAGPKWRGKLPAGVQKVRTIEDIAMVTFRVGYFSFDNEAESKADLKKAADFLRRLTVRPLSTFLKTGALEQSPKSASQTVPPFSVRTFTTTLAKNRPLALLGLISKAVKQPDCPLSVEEKKLLGRFGRLIKKAMHEVSSSDSDQPTATAMIQGLNLARQLIDARVRAAKPDDNGWVTILAGIWDNRWLDRATIAEYAIYANRPNSSIYPDNHVDAMGQPLDGKYKYIMKFEKGEFPPVTDFWSITIYRGDSLTFVANPINRYSIGNRTPGLKYGKDGSLTIYVQKDSPGPDKESNWLPAPDGMFNFLARYYGPKKAAQDGSYKLPALYREDEIGFLKDHGKLPKNW